MECCKLNKRCTACVLVLLGCAAMDLSTAEILFSLLEGAPSGVLRTFHLQARLESLQLEGILHFCGIKVAQ